MDEVRQVKLKKDGTPSKQGQGGGKGKHKVPIQILQDNAIAVAVDIAKAEFWLELAQNEGLIALRESLYSGDPAVRLRAAQEVMNRALGKPKETHEFPGEPLKIQIIRAVVDGGGSDPSLPPPGGIADQPSKTQETHQT